MEAGVKARFFGSDADHDCQAPSEDVQCGRVGLWDWPGTLGNPGKSRRSVGKGNMNLRIYFPLFLLLPLANTTLLAKVWAPRTDIEIAALDLRTGKLAWTYRPPKLGDAHFEAYKQGLVAYPHYSGDDKTNPIFLDPETGVSIKEFQITSAQCVARSATFWPTPKILLDNGWTLSGFDPGNTQTLTFVDGEKRKAWEIKAGDYPDVVRCWRNWVFYAFSYLSDEGVLYAYQAGAVMPTWKVDLNKIVKGRREPLTRMIFQVIENVLYVEANEHIFAFEPSTGRLMWHRDLAKDIGVPFDGGFFGGGLNLAVFAKADNTLVVSFEKRVVALDLRTMTCLWHLGTRHFSALPLPDSASRKGVSLLWQESETTHPWTLHAVYCLATRMAGRTRHRVRFLIHGSAFSISNDSAIAAIVHGVGRFSRDP